MMPYGAAGVSTEPERDNITAQAQRVLGLVNQAADRVAQIERRVYPPIPEKLAGQAPTPEPDHVVFVLRAAEERLGDLVQRLDRVSEAV
jgi:hypothetical protein